MKAILIKFRMLFAVVGISLAAVFAASSPAAAINWNSPSHEYRSTNGGWIPIYPCPTTACNPTGWVRSGTPFYMDCWQDWQYSYGNYWSSRWFYGYNGYWGYVHSSFVYGQTPVGHC